MQRRRSLFWPAVGVWCLLLLTVGAVGRVVTPDRPPHVVLIVLDALRADHLAIYGSRRTRTPSIDGLARRGIVFQRAYAQSSWCGSSMASLLTGTYPRRHGLLQEKGKSSVLPRQAVTLAEVLSEHGFRTIGVSANPIVSPAAGFDQGFDQLPKAVGGFRTEATALVPRTLEKSLAAVKPGGQPLFLLVHFLDPHDPYKPWTWCGERLEGLKVSHTDVQEGKVFRLSGEPDLGPSLETGGKLPTPHRLSADELEYLRRLYDCEIEEVDRALGRVLDLLQRRGILKDALVVLLADHGEEFLDHGLFRHGYQLYEESVHVPLVIAGPGLSARRWEQPVELVDLFPTVLERAGIESDGLRLDGEPLDLEDGPRPGTARAFGMTRFRKQHRAYLVEGQRKLIVDFRTGSRLLYDLNTDGAEQHGRDPAALPAGPAMLQRLLRLDGWTPEQGGAHR